MISNEHIECYGVIFLLLPLWGSSFWLRHNWIINSRFFIHGLMCQMSSSTKGTTLVGFKHGVFIFFFFVFIMNLWGLVPYTLPATSHMSMTFSLAILAWGSLIGLSMLNMKIALAENLPKESGWLSSFLIIVEVISSLIRPITLSFRLAANMTAGHVILGLMCGGCQLLLSEGIFMVFIIPSMYIMFEVTMCFAQAYVFVLLVSMYSNNYVF